jgi:hypothetical protein
LIMCHLPSRPIAIPVFIIITGVTMPILDCPAAPRAYIGSREMGKESQALQDIHELKNEKDPQKFEIDFLRPWCMSPRNWNTRFPKKKKKKKKSRKAPTRIIMAIAWAHLVTWENRERENFIRNEYVTRPAPLLAYIKKNKRVKIQRIVKFVHLPSKPRILDLS